MKKIVLSLMVFGVFNTISYSQDCFKRLEDAFNKRGSFTIADDIHRNVIVSFFEGDDVSCVSGKVRVESGLIVAVFLQYKDDTYELMEKKFYNAKRQAPTITNGISEMIFTPDGEKFRIVFIDRLKPKAKSLKQVDLPDDL
jgi:hypothetical protein